MKRLLESTKETPKKKHRSEPQASDVHELQVSEVPMDIWEHVTSSMNWEDINHLRTINKQFNNFFLSSVTINAHFFKNYALTQLYDAFDINTYCPVQSTDTLPMPSEGQWDKKNFRAVANTMQKSMKSLLDQYKFYREPGLGFSGFFGALAESGNIIIFNLLLKSQWQNPSVVIMQDDDGLTALSYAAIMGRKYIFNALLQFIINNKLPLMENGGPYSVPQLDYYSFGSILTSAMTSVHILAVRSDKTWLLDVLHTLSTKHQQHSVFPDTNYEKAVFCILNNDLKTFAQLLANDTTLVEKKDKAFWPLLHWALCFPHAIAIVKLLVALPQCDFSGFSVSLATAVGNSEALQTLISHVPPTVIAQGFCLHLAALYGHTPCMQVLLNHNKDDCIGINARAECGSTPLDFANQNYIDVGRLKMEFSDAVMEKKENCAKILIEKGAVESEENAFNL